MMIMSGTPNITPQGYTYAIEPNTKHPFWKEDGGESAYKYTDLQTPVEFENTDTNYTTFDLVQDDPAFFAPLTLSLVEVVINTEVALPFVGILHGDVAFLICEGVERNKLRAVGVYSSSDMSTLRVEDIKSTPAPIKGADGKDGVTPDVTASASVSNTTGVPSVNVTRSGSTASPVFDFSFMNIKGEKGEQGERGEAGSNGTDGVTPNVSVIATVDDTTGTPHVDVTKSGTTESPIFDFEFTGLKGEKGEGGSSGTMQRVFCSDGASLGSTLKTLQEKGVDECYITFGNYDIGNNDSILSQNFVAFKPYDGTTESFTLGDKGNTSFPSLRGVHFSCQKNEFDGNVSYMWQPVGYTQYGYTAKISSADSTKSVTVPFLLSPPSISANMTEFTTQYTPYYTEGASCYLQNANNYSSIIINVEQPAMYIKPSYAEVYYRG